MTPDDAELLQWVSEHTDHSLPLEMRYWTALKAFRDRARELSEAVVAEREACAKIAESGVDVPHPTRPEIVMKNFGRSIDVAAAIRSRQ